MPGHYYWIWGAYQGKKVALGPYNFEHEAQEDGHKKIPGFFEVVELPTRDVGMATRMLKARELQGGAELGAVLRPVSHIPPKGHSVEIEEDLH